MLDFFNDDIFAVDKDENVTRPEFTGLCPALDRRIERMSRRCNDFFAVCPDMNQLVRLVDIGFDNLFQRNIPGIFIPCPDQIANLDVFDSLIAIFRQHQCAGNKALPAGNTIIQIKLACILCSIKRVPNAICGFHGIVDIVSIIQCSRCVVDVINDICSICNSTCGLCDLSDAGNKWDEVDHITDQSGPGPGIRRILNDIRNTETQRNDIKNRIPELAISIGAVYGIISTVGKAVVAKVALSGRDVTVRIDETADLRVVIPGLEVVEPCFGIVVIAAILQGIDRSHFAGCSEDLTIGIVSVGSSIKVA